jgi:hypothetical protein
MINNFFSKINFEKFLFILTIILFSEFFTIIFLVVPSSILSNNLNKLLFFILVSSYFILSLIIPWLYIFFNNNSKKFINIFLTSYGSFIVFLVINFFTKIPFEVLIYFIFIKIIMISLSAFFKSILNFLFEKNEDPDLFKFKKGLSLTKSSKNSQENAIRVNLEGGIFFIVIYPIILSFTVNFYSILAF